VGLKKTSLTISRSNHFYSYNAQDEFCADLDRRLSLVRKWRDKGVSGTPQPWWPFPDSRHSSALETHTHRVSIVNTRDTPSIESLSTPPPRLQRKRHGCKLSADHVYKESNRLQALTKADPLPEQKRPDRRYRLATRTEAALIQEEEARREEMTTPEKIGAEEGFVYPQPAASTAAKPTRAQPIRQATNCRAQARKGKPIKTVYRTFNEEAFGKRSSPPSNPRRKSLLSLELKAEDDKAAESGQPSPFYAPLRPDGTQSESALKRQT
jgi:hypothetical protein